MNNRIIYKFNDFTINNYERLLKIAKERYIFRDYSNFSNKSDEIIWRHDVEFSPSIALEMAEIEAKLGVQANYFINIHSEFYSVFEKDTFEELKKIIELGHFVGLHFDAHFYDIKNENELCQKLVFEKELLEKIFNISISAFAFHNTTPKILEWNDEKIADLINVYSRFFREKVHYCTDSTGIWRYERLEDKLHKKKDCGLQVLTHDGMWQKEIMAPRQRVFKGIDERSNELKTYYDTLLKKHKLKNVDEDFVI